MFKISSKSWERKTKKITAKFTAENAELKDRVTKLEQKQTQVITNDQDASSTKDILQSPACSELSVNTRIQARSTISSEIRDESNTKGSLSIQLPVKGQSDKKRDITPDCLSGQENSLTISESETSTTSLSQDIINDDSAEILEFVETIHREKISNEIRERNRKKKLQGQEQIQNISSSSDIQNEVNPVIRWSQHGRNYHP